ERRRRPHGAHHSRTSGPSVSMEWVSVNGGVPPSMISSQACRVLTTEVTMPTYEYRCTKCGEHLEVVQSFKDAPLTECPSCGGELRKVYSPVGIVLKG